ncbi:MAG: hypothetical protein LBT21_06635 [Oscillospiraceae bacterium]|jgi:hypothetical protein|nr:hypothetical protein [Oscillospiraceae bacterium]
MKQEHIAIYDALADLKQAHPGNLNLGCLIDLLAEHVEELDLSAAFWEYVLRLLQ